MSDAAAPNGPTAHAKRMAARARRVFAAWLVLLLGSIAAAAMLPQFAFFVPVVAAAWIAARLGFLPGFLGHRHPGVRLVPGPDAQLTTFRAILEAESAKGPSERELFERLVERADAVGGPRAEPPSGLATAWRPGSPRDDGAGAELRIDDWPEVRESLTRGDGLVVASRASNGGRVRRIEAMVAGDRVVLESLALAYAAELRREGVEIVVTGWLRHAERVRAARRSRARA